MLRKINAKLIIIKLAQKVFGIILKISTAKIAKIALTTTPAEATITISRRIFLRRPKLTGTGLAHPNKKGECSCHKINGNITVPNISICCIGLSDRRPQRYAVSSPSFSAAYPCATSCSTTAIKTGMNVSKTSVSIYFFATKQLPPDVFSLLQKSVAASLEAKLPAFKR